MRVSAAAFVTCFASYTLAQGLGQPRNSTVDHEVHANTTGPVTGPVAVPATGPVITGPATTNITDVGKDVARFLRVANITSATGPSNFITQNILGTPPQIANFVNTLSLSTLQRLLGNNYGRPFLIPLYDETTRTLVGVVAGYFTSDGGVVFDTSRQLPAGSVLPNIQKQPSLIQPVTVTATGDIARGILARGSVTDDDLRSLLGADYGKPFRILIQAPGGAQVGTASGTFNADGAIFDAGTSIPKPNKVFTVTASGGRSGSIIQNGRATVGDLQALLGSNYGNGPFRIILTDNTGKQIGVVSGSFDGNGNPVFDSSTNIPTKVLTVTASGGRSASIIQAGKATNGDLQALLGQSYGNGPFKVILTDNNGNQIGIVSGSFDSNGNPVFDSSTNIPTKPLVATASASRSNSIIQAGQATTGDLRALLGANYGNGPFRITLTDSNGNEIGLISGYFDANGNPVFDSSTNIPKSAAKPINVTVGASQSSNIIAAGKVTDADLRQLLGSNYGKSFNLILTDNNGSQIGAVSGGFGSDGQAFFNSSSNIPRPTAGGPVTATATAGQSATIIANGGKVSDSVLRSLLGNSYGGPFVIFLVNPDGSYSGYLSGSFDSSGNVVYDAASKIPQPTVTVDTPAPPATTTSAANSATGTDLSSNHGNASFSGSADDIKNQLNSLSYDYILKAVGGKYGPFYIDFSSPDGSFKGYIKGTITKTSYSYTWSYTSTS